MGVFVKVFLSLFLFFSFLARGGWSVDVPSTIDPSLPSSLKKFVFQLEREKASLQGGAYALLYKGKVVYYSTFGHKKGTEGPITPHTFFSLASVSKSVTVTGLALMEKAHKIHLDLSASLSFSFLKDNVTLKQILGHSTGIPLRGNKYIRQNLPRSKLLDHIRDQVPLCSPGTCYYYSNLLFDLVQEVLERQGTNLQELMMNLQQVLKTEEICFAPWEHTQDIAYPHVFQKEKKGKGGRFKVLPLPYAYSKSTPAATGIFASLRGMIPFLQLISGYRPDLLSSETLKVFQSPLIKSPDVYKWKESWTFPKETLEAFYGLAWRIFKTTRAPEKILISHSGGLEGISSFIGYIPSEDVGFIALNNQDTVAHEKGIQFWEAFL